MFRRSKLCPAALPKAQESSDNKEQTTNSRLTSFWRTWEEWSGKTTLHGISFLFNRNINIVRRIFWLLVFASAIYALVTLTLIQYNRFYDYKTVTKTSYIHEDNLEMPAVTFCNFNFIKNSSINDESTRSLLKMLFLAGDFASIETFFNETYLNSVNLTKLFTDGAFTLQENYRNCIWKAQMIDCVQLLEPRYTDYGLCFSINKTGVEALSTSITGSDFGLILILWTEQEEYFIGDLGSAGFKVLVHDNFEARSMSNSGIALAPGFTHYLALQKRMSTFLPHPVKAFGKSECVDTHLDTFVNPLKFYNKYSVSRCIEECQLKYIEDACGCLRPYQKGYYPLCSPLQMQCTNLAILNFTQFSHGSMCDCPLPCASIHYDMTLSSAYFPNAILAQLLKADDEDAQTRFRNNILQVRIFFETKQVIVEEQVLEFTQEDLYASFGGFVGLAIGASFVTLVEILDVLLFSVVNCFIAPSKNDNKTKAKGDNSVETASFENTLTNVGSL